MDLQRKTKERIRRHVASAVNALSRCVDGLDSCGEMLKDDTYVGKQLDIAEEAIRMARDRLHDYQRAKIDAAENAFKEG